MIFLESLPNNNGNKETKDKDLKLQMEYIFPTLEPLPSKSLFDPLKIETL